VSTSTEARREELRASIARSETELRHAVRELRAARQAAPTIEERIVVRPTPWLVGAFAIGLWLAVAD